MRFEGEMKKLTFIVIFLILWCNLANAQTDKKISPSDCKTLYVEVQNELEKMNYCEQSSDCRTIELGGPLVEFGCFHFVNKSVNTQEIYERMIQYHQQCSGIIDDCSASPKSICVKNKCNYAGEKTPLSKDRNF